MSIRPSLDDSEMNNIFILKDNLEGSAGSLQQPEETDSRKKKEHLEYFKEGQQILY